MHAAAPAKRPSRVVTRSKSGAGAIPKVRPSPDPRRESRHKSSSESSSPSSPDTSGGGAMYAPPAHHQQHHPHNQQQQQQQQHQQPHHQQQQQQQGRRNQQQRTRQEQQQQQQQQQQQMSPQHLDTVRYLSHTWRTVQDECESSRAAGVDVSSMYYQEPAHHAAIQDIELFNLELWWGRRLHQLLEQTRGNS